MSFSDISLVIKALMVLLVLGGVVAVFKLVFPPAPRVPLVATTQDGYAYIYELQEFDEGWGEADGGAKVLAAGNAACSLFGGGANVYEAIAQLETQDISDEHAREIVVAAIRNLCPEHLASALAGI